MKEGDVNKGDKKYLYLGKFNTHKEEYDKYRIATDKKIKWLSSRLSTVGVVLICNFLLVGGLLLCVMHLASK